MDILFTATLIIHGRATAYDVTFEKDRYVFRDEENRQPTFTLYRENDEWKADGPLDEIAQRQAVDQLEHYLLQQH